MRQRKSLLNTRNPQSTTGGLRLITTISKLSAPPLTEHEYPPANPTADDHQRTSLPSRTVEGCQRIGPTGRFDGAGAGVRRADCGGFGSEQVVVDQPAVRVDPLDRVPVEPPRRR